MGSAAWAEPYYMQIVNGRFDKITSLAESTNMYFKF